MHIGLKKSRIFVVLAWMSCLVCAEANGGVRLRESLCQACISIASINDSLVVLELEVIIPLARLVASFPYMIKFGLGAVVDMETGEDSGASPLDDPQGSMVLDLEKVVRTLALGGDSQ